MIQTLLDAIHRQQIEQYEDEKVYELDCRNPKAEDSDVLLVTLAAEFLGLQKTIELALACHAKVVSLILWDPIQRMNGQFPAAAIGQEPIGRSCRNRPLWNFRPVTWI